MKFFTILLLFSYPLFSQYSEQELDSVLNIYKDQSWDFRYSDGKAATAALHKGLKIAKSYHSGKDISFFYRKLVSQKGFSRQMDSVQGYYDLAMHFSTVEDTTFAADRLGRLHSEMGEVMNMIGNLDQAIVHFLSADSLYKISGDSLGVVIIKTNLGAIYHGKSDYGKAIEQFHEAVLMVDTTQYLYIKSQVLGGLSASYDELGDIDKSIQFGEESLELAIKEIEIYPEFVPPILNNMAFKEMKRGNYERALAYMDYADSIIAIYPLEASKLQVASRKASLFLDLNQPAKAKKVLTDNLPLLDKYQLAAEVRFRYKYSLGKSYFKLGEKQEALKILFPLEQQADSLNLLKEVVFINETLSEIYAENGNYTQAYRSQKKNKKISDSIYSMERQKYFKEVDTRFETEKKERILAETRANLAESELKIKQRNNLIYGSLGLAAILGLLGYLFFSQQKLKNNQLKKEGELKEALARIETQNRLQEQRLRISRDLHDNIGSQLTFVTSSVDNMKFGLGKDHPEMGNKLDNISAFTTQTIYELRDTIWAMNKSDITVEDMQARIANFIEKARSVQNDVGFTFELDDTIADSATFTSVQGMNIYRIIQEAVNNALKYAEATSVEVKIDKNNSEYNISIEDDGKGFDLENIEMGHGLSNIKKRAKDLGGEAIIESKLNRGTRVSLRFSN